MSHLFVLGAGHVGLATAVGFARLGHAVTVADIDRERITSLQAGQPPNFEPGMAEAVVTAQEAGLLRFTPDLAPPAACTITFVCVATPTGPDGPLFLGHVEGALAATIAAVSPGHTIVVRSTLPLDGPARLRAAVEDYPTRATILTNPEFMREGQALEDFAKPNRVVIGWLDPRDEPGAQAVADLYRPLGAPLLVADADSVALIKLLSNVFLGMKVAYANEVARIADAVGADAAMVIRGVGLDARIGTTFLQPGPGFGGSCLPEQSLAIAMETAALSIAAPLLSSIHASNGIHQRAIVDRLASLLGGLAGTRIAILGLSFKANTDDIRESPGIAIARLLQAGGASVIAQDPRAGRKVQADEPDLEVASTVAEAIRDADAVVVTTEWGEYARLDWAYLAGEMRGRLVYDTRGVVDQSAAAAAGLQLVRLGGERRSAQVSVPG